LQVTVKKYTLDVLPIRINLWHTESHRQNYLSRYGFVLDWPETVCVFCRQLISEGFPSNSAWKITFKVGLKIGRANKERRKQTDKIKLLGTNGKEPTQTTAAKLT